jgi:membrane associated rhomboid family serine protease
VENLVTSQFLHASFGHIIGNMLFLHVFGDNLEDFLGHFKFLLFYLFCGVVAGLAQTAIDPTSPIPIVGASGAIAGLMGAYLVLFPHSKIDVLIPFGLYASNATVSAPFMLLYWIGAQFFYGMGSLGTFGGGVAYFAHIGGFIGGFLVAKILKKPVEIIPPEDSFAQF